MSVGLLHFSSQFGEFSAQISCKVLQLISDLQAKIIGEGEEAQKIYSEFSERRVVERTIVF